MSNKYLFHPRHYLTIAFFVVVFLLFPVKETRCHMDDYIRKPAASGRYYPSSPIKLKEMVKGLLQGIPPQTAHERPIALICPHASYACSGQVAAYSYKLLQDRAIERVILLGPSHAVPFSGISVWPEGLYKTPLGDVQIDKATAEKIKDASTIAKFIPWAHLEEHSIEVQVPFLQCVLKDFKIVPILVRSLSHDELIQTADILASLLKDTKTILIASTDLSHYHAYKEAMQMDKKTIEAIESGDTLKLYDLLRQKEAELCGDMSVLLLLQAVKQSGLPNKIRLLKYANSGDTIEEKERVVGYASMCVTVQEESDSKKQTDTPERGEKVLTEKEDLLNEKEQKKLLMIARSSIKAHLQGENTPSFDVNEPRLLEYRGAFVTLHKRGMLRGCIGYIKEIMPLYKAVSDCAVSAASKDYRFPPLQKKELSDIDIEISALTPLKKIDSIEQIHVGEHGLYISRSPFSGLLLPQVATEYGWDRKTFLSQTCRKAGLSEDAWEKGADIYIFSAQVFGEREK